MTLACPFPGCRTLVLITTDAEHRTTCADHHGLEALAETEAQFMARIRAELGWRMIWNPR